MLLADPVAALQTLKASFSRDPAEMAPVRPILEFSKVDPRFINEGQVLAGLETSASGGGFNRSPQAKYPSNAKSRWLSQPRSGCAPSAGQDGSLLYRAPCAAVRRGRQAAQRESTGRRLLFARAGCPFEKPGSGSPT
ncbi:MAG: hypothetical protein ACHQ7M_15115 [Chloroflexota bacterium]